MIQGSNLEDFFHTLQNRLNKFANKSDEGYSEAVRDGAELIREKVLKHIMVRRTRTEIKNYFSKDIKERGLFFPEVSNPSSIVYQFNSELNNIFTLL